MSSGHAVQGGVASIAERPVLGVAAHAHPVLFVLLRLILDLDGYKLGAMLLVVGRMASITAMQ